MALNEKIILNGAAEGQGQIIQPQISITSDIWTARNNNPFISLTAHFLSADFQHQHYVLNAQFIPGQHDGQRIAAVLRGCLQSWDVCIDRVHVMMRDNAGNMRVSGRELGVSSQP